MVAFKLANILLEIDDFLSSYPRDAVSRIRCAGS